MKATRFILLPLALTLVSCTGQVLSSPGSFVPASHNTSYGDETYTITFDSQGGSSVAPLSVKAGEIATRPTDPTKDGVYFGGWFRYKWGVAEYYFDEPVTANLTLYAVWSETPIQSSSSEAPESYTYTVTGMPTWIRNDDCVIFAWAWGGEDAGKGKWFDLEFLGDTSARFVVADEIDGFLLTRCAKDTTEPDWGKGKDDSGPGRIFNQTDNVTCQTGVYEYASAKWVDYPKSNS